jgi:hypothetical protein
LAAVVSQSYETCSFVPNRVALEVEIRDVAAALFHHFDKHANDVMNYTE